MTQETESALIPLEDAKLFLRIDGSEEDPLLSSLLEAAAMEAEAITHRAIRPAASEDGKQAGFTAKTLPAPIRQWILARVSSLYEQRESFAAGSSVHEFGHNFLDALLDPYIIHGGF